MENRKEKIKNRKEISLFFLFSLFCFLFSTFSSLDAQETKVFRGIYHLHSEFSPDSKMSLKKVIDTAKKAHLDFVVITDHNNFEGKSAYEDMVKNPKDPKLFFGAEISAPDGHLILFNVPSLPEDVSSSQNMIDWAHSQYGFAFLAHPICIKNPWKDWSVQGYDGLEVYNFAHAFYPSNKFAVVAKRIFYPRKAFLKSFIQAPYDGLAVWNEKLKERKLAAIFASDAHIHLQFWGINFENPRLQFESTSVFARSSELSEEAVLNALGTGHSYMAFEAFGNAEKFDWFLKDGPDEYRSGDTVQLRKDQKFRISIPQDAEIRLIHDGKIFERKYGKELEVDLNEKGYYRVEAYRKSKLWIVTNPIWVESPKQPETNRQ